MPKISALPPVADLAGDETVVMVKDGETRRGPVGDLVGAAAAPHVQNAAVSAAAAAAYSNFLPGTLAEAEAVTEEGDRFAISEGGTLVAYLRTAGGSTEISRAVTPASLGAPDGTGANIAKYRAPGAVSYLRGVGDKLDENRSALDFIDFNRHADIIEGTSTWDASDRINLGIADVGGRAIDLTPCARLAIGTPIELVRGTSLFSNGTFDNATGRGSKIFLLNGANCPMLLTPKAVAVAAGTDTLLTDLNQHNYLSLVGLIFDGNYANQTETTAAMKLGAVQWWGEYVGSELRKVMVSNTRGCGFSATGDINGHELWVVNCLFPSADYPGNDAANEAYNFRANPGYAGGARRGIWTFGSLFVELPRTSLLTDPKEDETIRGKAIHLNRLVSFAATHVHTEAALYGVTIESCQSVHIAENSGAWLGSSTVPDSAAASIFDADNDSIVIGSGMVFGGEAPAPAPVAPVAKRTGVSSQFFPNMAPASSGPSYSSYIAAKPSSAALTILAEALITNALNIMAVGATGGTELRLNNVFDGQQGDTAKWSGLRNNLFNEQVDFGSSKNQPGDAWKAFVRLLSTGNAFDSVQMLANLILARVANTSGFNNGALAMVGDNDTEARPMIRVRGQDWFLKPWKPGGVDPIGNVVPAHPCEYYNFNTQKLWSSTGNDINDWQLVN